MSLQAHQMYANWWIPTHEQARAWQQQRGWAQQGGWQGHGSWPQSRALHWESEHRTWPSAAAEAVTSRTDKTELTGKMDLPHINPTVGGPKKAERNCGLQGGILESLQIGDQVILFLIGEPGPEQTVVMIHNIPQTGEPAIVEEPAFLVSEQSF